MARRALGLRHDLQHGYRLRSPPSPLPTTLTNLSAVLITIRSLLDNKPYMHEPNRPDNPAYNAFVQYATWSCCLLDYIDREPAPALQRFLRRHVRDRALRMLAALARQEAANRAVRHFTSPYGPAAAAAGRANRLLTPNYPELTRRLKAAIARAQAEGPGHATADAAGLGAAGTGVLSGVAATALAGAALSGTKRPAAVVEAPQPGGTSSKRLKEEDGSADRTGVARSPAAGAQSKTPVEVIDLTDD